MSATEIVEVTVEDLDIEMKRPFGIAGGAQEVARNLLVRVRLRGGARGLGEAAPFPAWGGETQEGTRAALSEGFWEVMGQDAAGWAGLSRRLSERLGGAPSARCALEVAVLDALLQHHGMPMWSFFGGAGTRLQTDMTIPTGTAAEAEAEAQAIRAAGFATIKVKVGAGLEDDEGRLLAVLAGAPGCGLVLDGNAGLSVEEALHLLRVVERAGGRVDLFEQPLRRGEEEGMAEVARRGGVKVAADESATCAADVVRLWRAGAAQVVNIKLMKAGVVEALEMVGAARGCGMGLMIGGMVETGLSMTVSACLAAGQGGFGWVDLDTPMFLLGSPVRGGVVGGGEDGSGLTPEIDVGGIVAGHGVRVG